MTENINKNLFLYLLILLFFSIFFLYEKHNVGNDSTISEWIINYAGGFTKRGLIGEICIFSILKFILKMFACHFYISDVLSLPPYYL